MLVCSDSDSDAESAMLAHCARMMAPIAGGAPHCLSKAHVEAAHLLCAMSSDEEEPSAAVAGETHSPSEMRSCMVARRAGPSTSGRLGGRRGTYDRAAEGVGRRRTVAEYAVDHRQRIESNMFGMPCGETCLNGGTCMRRNFTQEVLLAAHERVYGARAQLVHDKPVLARPASEIRRSQRALMLSWITRDAVSGKQREVYMVERMGPVCAEFAKAAYDFRDWTWNTMHAAAVAGSLQVDADLEAAGVARPEQLDARDTSVAEMTITWWMLWLQLEDQMPNEPVIVHRAVIWLWVYDEEYSLDMGCWGASVVSRPRWTSLRSVALERLALDFFGQVADCDRDDPRLSQAQLDMLLSGGGFGVPVCQLSLAQRAQHSNFATCNECATCKQKWIEYRERGERCSGVDASSLKLELFGHIEQVKRERQVAMEMHQLAASRSHQTFEYDDKCGSEYCFQPTPGSRHTAATAGTYTAM